MRSGVQSGLCHCDRTATAQALGIFTLTYAFDAANIGIIAQSVFHRARSHLLHSRYHVAVGVQRDGDGRVPEHLGDYLRVDAFSQEERRTGVPEVVEAYVGQPGPPQERLPVLVMEVVAPDRCATPGAEHETPGVPLGSTGSAFVALKIPVPLQRLHSSGSQSYLTAAPPRLGLGEARPALCERERSPHSHDPLFEVHVVPPEPEELALPHSRAHGEDVEDLEPV